MEPLKGIRVIDFTDNLAGNLSTMYLASYGAEVIKIEEPEKGTRTRKYEPKAKGKSLYFSYLSRGTKSLALDLKEEKSKEILKKLIKTADVICESKGFQEMDKLGLGYEEVKEINANIIYASQSYYGHSGPYKDRPASSCTTQAYGVAMDMTGVDGGPPIKAGPAMGEHYAAGYLASSVVMAVIRREINGYGQKIDVATLDSLFSTIEAAAAAYSLNGEIQTRKGNFDPACAPYDTFKTIDGFVAVGVASETQWRNFAKNVVDMPELITHPVYSTNTGRCKDYLYNLRPILAEYIEKCSKYDIESKCRDYGIPSAEVMDVEGLLNHQHIKENNFLENLNVSDSLKFAYPRIPADLSETNCRYFQDVPEVGQHNEEILKELGY